MKISHSYKYKLNMKKIFFIFAEPTPYHSLLLRSIAKLGNIKVVVGFLNNKLAHHPWENNDEESTYDIRYINRIDRIFKTILQCFFCKPDLAIVGGYSNILLLFYIFFHSMHISFIFWGDTPNLAIRRPYLTNKMRMLLLNWIFKNSKAIFVSGDVGVDAYKSLGCPESKLRNVPLAIDLQKPLDIESIVKELSIEIEEHYAPSGETIFICVGQLIQRKNYAVTIRAFGKAIEQGISRNSILLIAGDGPQKSYLQALVESLGLSSRVHFLGWCQPHKLDALFYAGDVMIHTAEWDPYPVSVLGAMAWGLPILASDKSMSAVDRVRPGESGFIHRVGDVEELATHIRFFLDNPEAINLMGQKARATAEEWPVERDVKTILNLL